MKKYRYLTLLGFCIIIFTHLFMIAQVPRWANVDEAGIAYDAYCLSKYGVDRFCHSFPVFFINYGGGGQSPLFTYLLAFLLVFFDYSLSLVRFISAIASIITGYFGYKIITMLYDEVHGACFTLLYSIMPFFIMYYRIGMDCSLMLPASTAFLYFLIEAIRTNLKRNYFIAGIAGGIMLYTYTLSYIVLPIMLILSIIYLLYTNVSKRNTLYNYFIMALSMGPLALPLIVIQLINLLHLPTMKFGPFTFVCLPGYRSGEFALDSFLVQIGRGIKYTTWCDYLYYNASPKYGNFYYISLPFIIIGLFVVVKHFLSSLKYRQLHLPAIVLLWCISEYFLAGTMNINTPPHASRLNGVMFALTFFLSVGIMQCIRKCSSFFAIGISFIYSILFVCFCFYYFTTYSEDINIAQAKMFSADFTPVLNYLETDGIQYADDLIYLDEDGRYIYYVLADQTNPYDIPIASASGAYMDGYKNFKFSYPDEFDFSGHYVSEFRDKSLVELGYEEVALDGYYFYISPVSKVNISFCNNIDVIFNIEKITGTSTGDILIRGWCLDSNIVLESATQSYSIERFPRQDVADSLNISSEIPYGFICTIPKDVLTNESELHLVSASEHSPSKRFAKVIFDH